MVPFEVTGDPIMTRFKGVGNKNLSTYRFVNCKIAFNGSIFIHDFLVLPDNEAFVPFLFGRDLLKKMRIHLCQLEIKYSINELMN